MLVQHDNVTHDICQNVYVTLSMKQDSFLGFYSCPFCVELRTYEKLSTKTCEIINANDT